MGCPLGNWELLSLATTWGLTARTRKLEIASDHFRDSRRWYTRRRQNV